MANMGGNNPQIPVPVGILIDFGEEPEGNAQSTTPPRQAATEDDPGATSKNSSELLGAIQAALKDLSISSSGSGARGPQEGHSHSYSRTGAPDTASPGQHTYKSQRSISQDTRQIARTERASSRNGTPYTNNGSARRRSETPRGRRPRELSRKQLMEKLVETKYMPSLSALAATTKPARAVKHQRSDGRARPTLLSPLKSTKRIYISPEELEREGIKTINREPFTKLNTEIKDAPKLATTGASIAPHLRLPTVASTQQTIPSSSGPSCATRPSGASVLTTTTAATAAVLPNPANTSQTTIEQTNKKYVPFKAYSPQVFRSQYRAMPTAPVDATPTPPPTTYASVVAQTTPGPPKHLRFTRAKENKFSQTSRPRVPTVPQTRRWLTAPRAWPQLRTPATATPAASTVSGHLLPLPATLPAPRSMAVPRTSAAADLELLLSYSNPPTAQAPEQTVKLELPAPAPESPLSLLSSMSPPAISSTPSRSPTLSTAENLCPSPLPLRNIVSLQQEDYYGHIHQPGLEPDSTIIRQYAESPIMGQIESALGPAPLNASEELDASLLLIHYEKMPTTPSSIPSEVADTPLQHTIRPSASLEDLLGLDFF